MKAWKAIGLAALAIGLTPYRIERNEADRTSEYESLLYRMKIKRRSHDEAANTGEAATEIEMVLVPRLTHPDDYEDDRLSDRIEQGVEDLFGDNAEPVIHVVHQAADRVEDVVDKAKDAVEDFLDNDTVKETAEKVEDAAFDAVNHAANQVKDALDGE